MFNYKKTAAYMIIGLVLSVITSCTPGKTQMKQNNYDNEKSNYGSNEDTLSDDYNRQGNRPNVRSGMKSQDMQGNLNKNRVSSRDGNENKDGYNDRNSRNDSENNGDRNNIEDKSFTNDNNDNRYQDNNDKGRIDDTGRDSSMTKENFFQTGMASWYGREFHGKVTASGEKFNMNKFTGAHKTLPFGTVAEIKNLDNGKTAIIEINDRGPYRGNRIIDLSYGAAKNLGMLSTGLTMVGIKLIKKVDKNGSDDNSESRYNTSKKRDIEPVVGDDNDDERVNRNSKTYSIQAGAFYSKRKAELLKRKIEDLTRNSVSVINDGDLYKVRVDGIESKKEAKKFKSILKDEKIEGYIINKE